MSRLKIGLLAICVGKYSCFLKHFAESAAKYFFAREQLTMCLWSDNPQQLPMDLRSFEFPSDLVKWPGPTLWRYRLFLAQAAYLQSFDVLYYCDVDMEFCAPVRVLGDLVATIHPGFYKTPIDEVTFERRFQSRACITKGKGRRYYAGGFQGGRTTDYLAACHTINQKIEDDYARGVIAMWHDESHWNRYLLGHPPDIELSPWYCWSEACAKDYPEAQAKLKIIPKHARSLRS